MSNIDLVSVLPHIPNGKLCMKRGDCLCVFLRTIIGYNEDLRAKYRFECEYLNKEVKQSEIGNMIYKKCGFKLK